MKIKSSECAAQEQPPGRSWARALDEYAYEDFQVRVLGRKTCVLETQKFRVRPPRVRALPRKTA